MALFLESVHTASTKPRQGPSLLAWKRARLPRCWGKGLPKVALHWATSVSQLQRFCMVILYKFTHGFLAWKFNSRFQKPIKDLPGRRKTIKKPMFAFALRSSRRLKLCEVALGPFHTHLPPAWRKKWKTIWRLGAAYASENAKQCSWHVSHVPKCQKMMKSKKKIFLTPDNFFWPFGWKILKKLAYSMKF